MVGSTPNVEIFLFFFGWDGGKSIEGKGIRSEWIGFGLGGIY